MHSLHYLLPLHSKPTIQPWLRPLSFTNFEAAYLISNEFLVCGKRKTHQFLSSSCVVYGVEKESQHFEVDPDKAREALRNLDQQLQSLSEKKVRPPKIKGILSLSLSIYIYVCVSSDVKLTRDQEEEKETEFSASFLAYFAGALFLFTIFYNVLFYTVIKPSIDGPDQPPSTPTAAIERQIQK
ncbi:hypothetical protein FEM48_Zijuj02G0194100 [Ziziphus jujuba var. spinosa]|uniref:Uncharacterized protein n=1 Tax=Ziziphus jujuba var. spinosa TaxID=714518 RepID=A0A978VXI9_ZIZJJ|nr:hypothetical protein FEM48_Zijuj02G0194100 [Ziziphus jujuba var. spinosa]